MPETYITFTCPECGGRELQEIARECEVRRSVERVYENHMDCSEPEIVDWRTTGDAKVEYECSECHFKIPLETTEQHVAFAELRAWMMQEAIRRTSRPVHSQHHNENKLENQPDQLE